MVSIKIGMQGDYQRITTRRNAIENVPRSKMSQ